MSSKERYFTIVCLLVIGAILLLQLTHAEESEESPEEPEIPDSTPDDSQNSTQDSSVQDPSEDTQSETEVPELPEIQSPSLIVDLADATIEEGDDAIITIVIDSPDTTIQTIRLSYGDGSEKITHPDRSGFYSVQENKLFSQHGNYNILVTVKFSDWEDISASQILSVSPSEDYELLSQDPNDKKPTLSLLYPANGAIIKSKNIVLRFKPNDDYSLKECNFSIHKGTSGTLEYQEGFLSPELNKELSVSLKDFENADYTWEVKCTDNSSQSITQSQMFTVRLQENEYESEILDLMNKVEHFLDKENSFNPDEKMVLNQLGILENTRFYKKRISQINQELSENYLSILDDKTRKEKDQKLMDELKDIRKDIPLDMEIVHSEEYITNSLPVSLGEIASQYVTNKGLNLNERRTKILAKKNEEIQSKISSTTKVIQLEIEYENANKQITFIQKSLRVSDGFNNVLEILPSEMASRDVIFVTTAQKIANGLYEINLAESKSDKITYYVFERISPETIKESKTVLFEKFSTDGFTLVGFSILGFDVYENHKPLSIIIFFLVALAGSFTFVKVRKKNAPQLDEIKALLKKGKTHLKKDNLEEAREIYKGIRGEYKELSKKDKTKIYKKISFYGEQINKRDMVELIKEYKIEKRKNTEHAKILYEMIKQKHTKLPEKFQKKIREKILID